VSRDVAITKASRFAFLSSHHSSELRSAIIARTMMVSRRHFWPPHHPFPQNEIRRFPHPLTASPQTSANNGSHPPN
jgi:hypothetical protein